jgi:multiple sugar transport system ATP-binding protein
MATLELAGLRKSFAATHVLHKVDLTLDDGEMLVIVGASGCGKSTLLRLVAGLEQPTEGRITLAGRDISRLDPAERDIAMVFQNYALYPHMTVFDNMAYALKIRGLSATDIKARVAAAAALLNIEPLLARKPRQLSGGQRQRVAMGRAIVRNPKVFLFDEPLSNLDAKLRVQMRTEIKKVHQQVRTTTVYVTHDQVEAMTLADRVVVMNKGVIEQVGSPQELYHNPKTRFVAGFIGSPAMNFIPCRLENGGDDLNVRLTDGIIFKVPPQRAQHYKANARDGKLLLGLRPEHITEAGPHLEPGEIPFDAHLDVTEPMGMETLVYFPLNGTQVCGRVNPNAGARDGAPMKLAANLNNMHLIDEATGRVI